MTDVSREDRKRRLAYERPRVYAVKLIPDESVLAVCKLAEGGGNGPWGHCRQPAKCYSYGS